MYAWKFGTLDPDYPTLDTSMGYFTSLNIESIYWELVKYFKKRITFGYISFLERKMYSYWFDLIRFTTTNSFSNNILICDLFCQASACLGLVWQNMLQIVIGLKNVVYFIVMCIISNQLVYLFPLNIKTNITKMIVI